MLIRAKQKSNIIPDFQNWVSTKRGNGFTPNIQQLKFIKYWDISKNLFVKHPRQCGISSLIAAKVAYNAIYGGLTNYHIVLICPTLVMAHDLFLKVIDWLQYDKTECQVLERSGNLIKISVLGKTISIKACSNIHNLTDKYDLVVFDGAAYFAESTARDFYSLIKGFINNRTKMIICSTPNKHDCLFYTLYKDILNGNLNFTILNFHWYFNSWQNKGLKWYQTSNITNNEPTNFIKNIQDKYSFIEEMVLDGYIPTSDWSESMKRFLSEEDYNKEVLAQF